VLLISTAIELTQLLVPDRSADIDDVIVNVAGALLGYLASVIVRAVLRPRAAPQ
jgi:glycopeptide antibiotics resistance protein